jgi:hypothetical protein
MRGYRVAVPLEYVDDLTPANWIAERLHPFAQDAGAIIPPGFEAYARIFHPASRRVGDAQVPVTWREIADANLRVHHPQMQFGSLVSVAGVPGGAFAREPQPGLFDSWPRTGSLPLSLAGVLVDVVGNYTGTSDRCWFAAWEGWGDFRDGSAVLHTLGGSPHDALTTLPPGTHREKPTENATLKLPNRGYYLARGPLAAAIETVYGITWAYQSASIWWPDDRAWCVATEVDFDWTYVGGSTECIAAILSSPDLEALPARLSDGVTYASDPINPTPLA